MHEIIVYTKDNCPQCTIAKSKLRAAGLAFSEVNVSRSPLDRDWLIAQGHRAVPVIYCGEATFTADELVAINQFVS